MEFNNSIDPSVFEPTEVITQAHAINTGEIILISAVFIFLAYWYIRVTKNRVQYESWTNPNGTTINLYKKIRWLFWMYVGVVVVLGTLQILLV
jgi:hypothetical protein